MTSTGGGWRPPRWCRSPRSRPWAGTRRTGGRSTSGPARAAARFAASGPAGAGADWRAVDVRSGADGSTFRVIGPGGVEADVSVGLAGVFNVANALGAVVALVEAGGGLEDAVGRVAACPGGPGRR